MINHHQNININICYNMQSQKNNKNITGKKIQKIIKTTALPNTFNPLESKLIKKNNQNNLKKSNQSKVLTESKKNSKKKNINFVRNIQTPDLFIERRIKTQAGLQLENSSSFKKELKRPEFKSTHPAFYKNNLSVKKQKNSKNTKKIQENHIKSCDMYGGWKKLNTEENVLSQSINGVAKKKRTNSAILRNDKVVSRLLNISLLASQLGGSQPITSERKSSVLKHSKSFKECMTSIDMRIIRNIQDDIPIFEKKESKSNEIIKLTMKFNSMSLQQLIKKTIIIQRAWRMKKKTSIIDIYKRLFMKATNNLNKQNNIDNVSDISRQSLGSDSLNHFQIFKNQNLAISLKKSNQNSQKGSIDNEQEDEYPLRWIQQTQFQSKVQERQQSDELNFKKYKQLVKEEIISLNKKIPINGKKLGLDSKLLIDELIKQNFNKKWIEDQSLSNSQRNIRISQDFNFIPSEIEEQDSDLNRNSIETFPKRSKHEEDDSFDDSQVYNNKKYAMNGQEISEQTKQHFDLNEIPHNYINLVKNQRQQSKDLIHDKEELKMDQQWINNEILSDNNVVRSYLDCGLDNFSLKIKKISGETYLDKNIISQVDKQQTYSSDQAIGARFQRANLGILRKSMKNDEEIQPIVQVGTGKVIEQRIEQIVGNLIEFLINEFSSDISLILKKSVSPVPVQKLPLGIQTNYNSIKVYISKFIQYASQNAETLKKISENINKDIAPSSLQILTYLRPQQDDEEMMNPLQNEENDDEDGLFVVPAEMFEEYENYLQAENRKIQLRQSGPRVKAYMSFWHRSIFQSYNECLDYERPYGIEGKPYQWVGEMKINRPVKTQKIVQSLHKAEDRLLELSTIVCGIIFEKPDSPFEGIDFNEDQMHMMNEQRLSRILATELLQNERSWINYNDELAQLLVELSRMIEQKLFFEQGSEIKKLYRRRKLIAEESLIQKGMSFNIEELQ